MEAATPSMTRRRKIWRREKDRERRGETDHLIVERDHVVSTQEAPTVCSENGEDCEGSEGPAKVDVEETEPDLRERQIVWRSFARKNNLEHEHRSPKLRSVERRSEGNEIEDQCIRQERNRPDESKVEHDSFFDRRIYRVVERFRRHSTLLD